MPYPESDPTNDPPGTPSVWGPVTEGLIQDNGSHVSATVALEVQGGRYVPQTECADFLIANLTLSHRPLEGMNGAGHHRLLSLDFSPLIAWPYIEVKVGSGARMEPFVDFSESRPTDVRVDLGGGNIGMSQHELQGTEVRPMFQEMSGE